MPSTPPRKTDPDDALTPEEKARRNYRRKRRFKIIGSALAIVGGLIILVHWLTHLEAFGPGQPDLWLDIIAGYPMGAVLLMAGAIVGGQK